MNKPFFIIFTLVLALLFPSAQYEFCVILTYLASEVKFGNAPAVLYVSQRIVSCPNMQPPPSLIYDYVNDFEAALKSLLLLLSHVPKNNTS